MIKMRALTTKLQTQGIGECHSCRYQSWHLIVSLDSSQTNSCVFSARILSFFQSKIYWTIYWTRMASNCQLVCAILLLSICWVSFADSRPAPLSKEEIRIGSSGECELCTWIVGQIQELLLQNATDEEIVTVLNTVSANRLQSSFLPSLVPLLESSTRIWQRLARILCSIGFRSW